MEAQFEKCQHCEGVGTVKTLDFAAITAMRAIEEEGIKNNVAELSLNVPNNVAVYILNNKRSMLADIEKRYEFRVHIRTDDELMPSEFRLDIMKNRDGEPLVEPPKPNKKQNPNQNKNKNQNKSHSNNDEDGDVQHPKKKSRRRGRRGGRKNNRNQQQDNTNENANNNQEAAKGGDQKSDKPHDSKTPNDNKKQSKPKAESKNAKSAKKEDGADGEKDLKSKKTPKKKPAAKKAKAEPKSGAKKPSNDVKPSAPKDEPKSYETVNKEPAKKKKGWWNRLVD